MWRPADEDRVLLMAGRTTRYAIDPRGEYVFGVLAERPMRSRRERERRVVAPGELVAWDPSGAHAGSAIAGQPWSARLMVVEVGELAGLAGDADETDLLADVAFPDPVLADPVLARDFVRLHTALEAPTDAARARRASRRMAAGADRPLLRRPPRRSPLTPRDRRALRRASDYLGDQPERNVGLDELAAVAGTIAGTAVMAGFVDQSHLHRHFQRSLGLTPGEYQRRLTA